MARWLRHCWPYVLVLLCATALLTQGLTRPFVGQDESSSANISNWARNFARYGALNLRGALIRDSGPLEYADQPHTYLHYSPYISFLVSLSFRAFGVHEWSARLVAIVHALGSLIIFLVSVERFWGRRVAVVAGLFLAFMPTFAWYGRVLADILPGLFYLMAALLCYGLWLEPRGRWAFAGLLVSVFLGTMVSYEGMIFSLVLALHCVFTRGERSWAILAAPLAAALACLVTALVAVGVVGFDGLMADFARAWQRRGVSGQVLSTYGKAAASIGRSALQHVTLAPLALALVWAVRLAQRKVPSAAWPDTLIAPLILTTVVAALIFPGQAISHQYVVHTAAPSIALAAALGLLRVLETGLDARPILRVRGVVFTVLVLALFVRTASLKLSELSSRTFYSGWQAACQQLNRLTASDESIAVNFHYDPDGFLGGYPQFYLDRHLRYSVTTEAEARAAFADERRKFALWARFYQHRPSGDVFVRAARKKDVLRPGRVR